MRIPPQLRSQLGGGWISKAKRVEISGGTGRFGGARRSNGLVGGMRLNADQMNDLRCGERLFCSPVSLLQARELESDKTTRGNSAAGDRGH